MTKNATIGTVVVIAIVLIGAAVFYQSTKDTDQAVVTDTGSETTGTVTTKPGTTGTTVTTTGTKPATGAATTSTTSPAVSVGTPGYVDYTMKTGESVNIAGYTATLTSIGATEVSVKLVKGPTTSNQTYKLKVPNTGYGFTGEVRSIDTTAKSVVFRATILP